MTTVDNVRYDTIQIEKIVADSLPSGSKSIYYFSKDTIFYFVRTDTLIGSQTNRFAKMFADRIDNSLRLLSDTTIISGYDTFNIFKFRQNETEIDRSIMHYWEKNIGVFSVHFEHTPGLTKLQTDDTSLNQKINKLIDLNVPSSKLARSPN